MSHKQIKPNNATYHNKQDMNSVKYMLKVKADQ